ncbi:uncharacterized protein cubi_00288 [Cryptosporidium ubiquitum]|uniref:Uncharacterized protein n=1 Tax=Cryptosporidium ubiquitum TaxID=857276 RepID=A0A1J4ML27_9CRYT|nr:uncharacterized protein cubi_00288 [Cryptosporidium ubiquitum]OII74735.1 hypothetical protein cubi_00288 [Cryptosporidium ubiquitum]
MKHSQIYSKLLYERILKLNQIYLYAIKSGISKVRTLNPYYSKKNTFKLTNADLSSIHHVLVHICKENISLWLIT